MSFDPYQVKADFPLLARTVRGGKPLIYLDSGATSQKPEVVIRAEQNFYEHHNAAAHRGAHQLAEEATELFEGARTTISKFINSDENEVVFTKSATESINLLAYSLSNPGSPINWMPGDRILATVMEHHANLIPWQQLSKRVGAELDFIDVTDQGELDLSNLESLVTEKTKIIAFSHASNVLGGLTQTDKIVKLAGEVGALTVLDACQSVPHEPVDVQELGIDFMAFSGHKMLGPTGVGVLFGKYAALDSLPPFLTGGSMIENVTLREATFSPVPKRFEAGVPNMAQAVGLAAAVDYLSSIGMHEISKHEANLVTLAINLLTEIPGLQIIGSKGPRGGAVSFVVDGIHAHDLGQVLDDDGIAVRVGHHCAWPLMRRFRIPATTRATFYLYNTQADVYALVESVKRAIKFFGGRL